MDINNLDMMESGINLDFDLDSVDITGDFADDLLKSMESMPINFYEPISKPAPVQSPSFKTESINSRTQLRQQLMKDQLLKERERNEAKERARTDAPEPTAKKPIQHIENVAVPQHVLRVTTGLQNPTKYHIKAMQTHQVRQYLSSSQKEKGEFLVNREAYSAPLVQNANKPSTVTRPSASFTVPPPSPGMASFTSGGTSDAEDVLEGLISYEESSYDAQKYGSNASLGSCDDAARVKKDTHNRIERRRRYNINDRIKELGDLLPQRNEPHYDIVRDSRTNKGTILKSSVDYIKILKNDLGKMKIMENDNRQLQQENRKLLLRIQQLEIEAQSKGVVLKERTWKPVEHQVIIDQYIRGKGKMPDVVTEASACVVYDDSMEEVVSPDPMLSAAAALPKRQNPKSPTQNMDFE